MRSGKLCIEVTPDSRIAFLSESLCIGITKTVRLVNIEVDVDEIQVAAFVPKNAPSVGDPCTICSLVHACRWHSVRIVCSS